MRGMGNMQQMMRKMQKMQKDMMAAQESLKDQTVEGTVSGGMVTAVSYTHLTTPGCPDFALFIASTPNTLIAFTDCCDILMSS